MEPKVYRGAVHEPGCCDAACAERYATKESPTFCCPRCWRLVGYCMGAADEMPSLCDDCWAAVDAA